MELKSLKIGIMLAKHLIGIEYVYNWEILTNKKHQGGPPKKKKKRVKVIGFAVKAGKVCLGVPNIIVMQRKCHQNS